MKIFVNIKKVGKRKNSITQVPYYLSSTPKTVRELIEQIVTLCTEDYNKRQGSQELLKNLSLSEMKEQSASGKTSFEINYNEKKADIPQRILI